MQLDPIASPRPPSRLRALAKFVHFLLRGHTPIQARWLAAYDAPKAADARGVSREALAAAYHSDPSWSDIQIAEGRVTSRALGLAFSGDDATTRGYRVWRALAHRGWSFSPRPEGGLLARWGDFALALTTDEETEMIREIFLAGCYDVRLAQPCHVIDIGGNVGMAALWFARQANITRVTSFEPFAPTAEGYRANVALNPALAPKITLITDALGETETTLQVDYVPSLRGSMSVSGLGGWRHVDDKAVGKIPIHVVPAAPVIGPLLAAAQAAGARVLAKIDCEGSEYAIFRNLEAAGLLGAFHTLLIEWHGLGPDDLVAALLRHGFVVSVMPLSEDGRSLGLIHATRQP